MKKLNDKEDPVPQDPVPQELTELNEQETPEHEPLPELPLDNEDDEYVKPQEPEPEPDVQLQPALLTRLSGRLQRDVSPEVSSARFRHANDGLFEPIRMYNVGCLVSLNSDDNSGSCVGDMVMLYVGVCKKILNF